MKLFMIDWCSTIKIRWFLFRIFFELYISKETALPNTKIQFYRKIKSMIKKNDIRSVPTYHTMMSDAITEVQYGTVEVAIVW
jgi:hypothetical protein